MDQINYDKKYLNIYYTQKTTGESYAELALAFLAVAAMFLVFTVLFIGLTLATN